MDAQMDEDGKGRKRKAETSADKDKKKGRPSAEELVGTIVKVRR